MFSCPVNSVLMFHPKVGTFASTRSWAPVKETIVAIGSAANTLSCDRSAWTCCWFWPIWSSRSETSSSLRP